jgi:hypothetical protein
MKFTAYDQRIQNATALGYARLSDSEKDAVRYAAQDLRMSIKRENPDAQIGIGAVLEIIGALGRLLVKKA